IKNGGNLVIGANPVTITSMSSPNFTLEDGAILNFNLQASPNASDTLNLLQVSAGQMGSLTLGTVTGGIIVNLFQNNAANTAFLANGTYNLITNVDNVSGGSLSLTKLINPIFAIPGDTTS